MAVNHLEATLHVCYCPTRTFTHELLVIWPVGCLAWLPCTEHQSCEHLSHEDKSAGPLGYLMAVNHLEATLHVCYCLTRTFAHELLVIWPVVCLACYHAQKISLVKI